MKSGWLKWGAATALLTAALIFLSLFLIRQTPDYALRPDIPLLDIARERPAAWWVDPSPLWSFLLTSVDSSSDSADPYRHGLSCNGRIPPCAIFPLTVHLPLFFWCLFRGIRHYRRAGSGGSRRPEDLASKLSSPDTPSRDRLLALERLESFGEEAAPHAPAVIALLTDGNPLIRQAAAACLPAIRPDWMRLQAARQVIKRLLRYLAEDDPRFRQAALDGIGHFGPAAADAVPSLLQLLDDPEYDAKARAALTGIGSAAVPEIISELFRRGLVSDQSRRLSALLPELDPDWKSDLSARGAIQRTAERFRDQGTAEALEWLRLIGETGRLVSLLPDLVKRMRDRETRKSALEILAKIGPPAKPVAGIVAPLLGKEDAEIRAAAAACLTAVDPDWRTSDETRGVVRRIVAAMEKGGGQRRMDQTFAATGRISVRPLVEALGRSAGRSEKQSAERQTSDVIRKRIVRCLTALPPEAWSEAVDEPGGADLMPILNDFLAHKDWSVRLVAVNGLGHIGPPAIKTMPRLVKAMTDPSRHVQNAAREAVTRVAVKNPKKAVETAEQRKAAVKNPDLLPAELRGHVTALKAASSKDREAAARELGRLGAAALGAVPFLLDALADPEADVRNAVVAALSGIQPEWRDQAVVRTAISEFIRMMNPDVGAEFVSADGALEALLLIGEPAIPHLIPLLTNANRSVVASVSHGLERIRSDWEAAPSAVGAVPELVKALESGKEWYARQAAADVLGRIGPPARAAMPALVKAMADPNRKVKVAAKGAMQRVALRGN